MIPEQNVEVIITNQGKYYASLGYTNTKQGTILCVPIEHLPKNSNKRVECICDQCGVLFKRQYQLLNKNNKCYEGHFCFDCSRDLVGKNMDFTNTIKASRLRVGSEHHNYNPNKPAFQAYASKVRKITEDTYKQFKQMINPDNLPRTLCGVDGGFQLDHKVSIYRGFCMGINPKILGSLDNLQMLSWQDNRSKHK